MEETNLRNQNYLYKLKTFMSTLVTELETLRGLGMIERQPMECLWMEI